MSSNKIVNAHNRPLWPIKVLKRLELHIIEDMMIYYCSIPTGILTFATERQPRIAKYKDTHSEYIKATTTIRVIIIQLKNKVFFDKWPMIIMLYSSSLSYSSIQFNDHYAIQ